MDRRSFIRTGVVATAAFTSLGRGFWRGALASHAPYAPGPTAYGTLRAPDANGMRLPEGFASRVVGTSGQLVPGTAYRWHTAPDGGATYALPDGGWVYVSNSEEALGRGGAGALRFDASGAVIDAYPILAGTNRNCAGGPTPWGTWLSCEENDNGLVWECDPLGVRPAVPRPAMGAFNHEAAAVDPVTRYVYLTEDKTDGCLYRFRPAPDAPPLDALGRGTLEVARANAAGVVSWLAVPQPIPAPVAGTPTRHQVIGVTRFSGGEGAWFDDRARTVYFATKNDDTIWAYDVEVNRIEILFTSTGQPGSAMNGVDNIALSSAGEIWVCEDHNTRTPLEMIVISPSLRTVGPFLELVEPQHDDSELTGVAFDPSGTRMYFSSQRANAGAGVTYEVTGPFRR